MNYLLGVVILQDIDNLLKDWKLEPGNVQARLIAASDKRSVIQLRIDMGVLQLEVRHRPDGERPNGCRTYLEFLQRRMATSDESGEPFVMSDEECREADREFVQFYHRRICWLALQKFKRAIADADHTLAFMDFVRDHCTDDEYVHAHEQYRVFVLFQRTQAAAALRLEKESPAQAIEEVQAGVEKIEQFFAEYADEPSSDDHPMIEHLRNIERSIREQHAVGATLQEQLDDAIEKEEYERAARVRDMIKQKGI